MHAEIRSSGDGIHRKGSKLINDLSTEFLLLLQEITPDILEEKRFIPWLLELLVPDRTDQIQPPTGYFVPIRLTFRISAPQHVQDGLVVVTPDEARDPA